MRLHRLTLRDVKGVAERTVDFPDTGVIVIEGPNEVGKSTLLEALDRLLDSRAKASSKSTAIKALQPVGVDAGPFVEAELTVGPYRVVFAKQWLRQTSTVLRVIEPVAEHLTGDRAQTRMSQILDECLDRPLFDALRFTQAGELTQIPLSDSDVLAAALDGAAGADLHTDSGGDLLGQVEAEFLTYFTPTGRPTGAFRSTVAEVTEAQDLAVQAHGRLVEGHAMLAERERVEADLLAVQASTPVLERQAAQAEADAVAAGEVVEVERAAAEALRRAHEVCARTEEDQRVRAAQIEALAQRASGIGSLTASLADLDDGAEAVAQERAVADAAWSAARDRLDSAQQVIERATLDAEHLAELAEAERLDARLSDIRSLTATLSDAEGRLAGQRVDPTGLLTLRLAEHTVEIARAKADAVATVVSVEALADDQRVEIAGTSHSLSVGQTPIDQSVSHETDIVVPGAVRVRIRPVADAAALAEELDGARQALARALSGAGVESVPAAVEACAERETANAEVTRLRAELGATLNGDPVEVLAERLEQARAAAAVAQERRAAEDAVWGGSGRVLPADVTQAKAVVSAAQHPGQQARLEVATADNRRDGAHRATAEHAQRRAVLEARLEGAVNESSTARHRLEEARAGRPDADLEHAVARAADSLTEATGGYESARGALTAVDARGAEQRVQAAVRDLEQHRREVETARDRLHHLKGRIEMAAGEGRQEAYELALRDLAEATTSLTSIDRRARAARHLHETLQRHRAQAHDTYVQPYRAELERLGRQVYDASFGVTVSRDLLITHRQLHGTSVPFDSLSGGAKEQLGILARLAVASLVDAEHGVPVVIDDALGYTDPARLRRVGQVLADPAAKGQVILLTCTPARYAAIEGASTVSLTA